MGGVERAARALGFEVARDTPFSGTFVPSALLGDTRVAAVMLEVRRDKYMDEGTGLLHDGRDAASGEERGDDQQRPGDQPCSGPARPMARWPDECGRGPMSVIEQISHSSTVISADVRRDIVMHRDGAHRAVR